MRIFVSFSDEIMAKWSKLSDDEKEKLLKQATKLLWEHLASLHSELVESLSENVLGDSKAPSAPSFP